MPDLDTALLVIDNSAPVLARIMLKIRLAIGLNGDVDGDVCRYVRLQAANDLGTIGDRPDRENASLLRRSLKGATEADWQEIARHYRLKHTEGNVMREYLSDELRALEAEHLEID